MFNLIIIVQCIIATISVEVKYFEFGIKPQKLQVFTTKLTNQIFNVTTYQLNVEKYDGQEEQIEMVANLPRLSDVWMVNIGQNLVPVFQNLPKITVISLDKNNLGYIKKEAFNTIPVEWILLDNNQISVIEKNSFGPSVRIVSLRCNKITMIQTNWFQSTSKLVSFDISGNQISSLQENLFKDFHKLDEIILAHNKIATIGNGAFSNCPRFVDLQLNHNMLTELHKEMFMPQPVIINHFYINNNQLTFLKKDFMDKLNVTTKARIYGNPWQCACYDLIRVWIPWDDYKYDKDPEGAPRCVAASSIKYGCVPQHDHELISHYFENAPPPETVEQFCSD